MKKLLIYLAIVVVIFGGLFALNRYTEASKDGKAMELYGKLTKDLNPSTAKQLNDKNYQGIILPEDLSSKVENKESMFIYFFSSDCGYCKRVTPVLYPLSQEHGIDLHQFNYLEFGSEFSKYQVSTWPTLVYFQDGVEVDRLAGEHPKATYDAFFAKYKAQ